jgi:Fe-coproporphyrin III synthase
MDKLTPPPREICIILTYRCNARCNMCDVWHHPTKIDEEIKPESIAKLPSGLRFINITGGEPFIRQDLGEIITIVKPKSKRIVISTNGYFTDRILSLCAEHPDLGIRISIEGLPGTNDGIRGMKDGFDKGFRTLLALRKMGCKDIGFGITVQDINCKDLLPLYELSEALGYEFATATLHNSHYFHKLDNKIHDTELVCGEFSKLITELLKSKSPKKWFRAYLNFGLMNYVYGNKRLLKCGMASEACFIDPEGDILACNGMNSKAPMGNIIHSDFAEIWNSEQAKKVRRLAGNCTKECWMTGNAVPAMRRRIHIPLVWVIKNKIRVLMNKNPVLSFDHT